MQMDEAEIVDEAKSVFDITDDEFEEPLNFQSTLRKEQEVEKIASSSIVKPDLVKSLLNVIERLALVNSSTNRLFERIQRGDIDFPSKFTALQPGYFVGAGLKGDLSEVKVAKTLQRTSYLFEFSNNNFAVPTTLLLSKIPDNLMTGKVSKFLQDLLSKKTASKPNERYSFIGVQPSHELSNLPLDAAHVESNNSKGGLAICPKPLSSKKNLDVDSDEEYFYFLFVF